MALSDFTGPGYIEAWTADLDRRWPERDAMADCVVRTLVRWADSGWRGRDGKSSETASWDCGSGLHETKPPVALRLLELGVGAAGLARDLIRALIEGAVSGKPRPAESTGIEYTGVEIEPALIAHGRKLISAVGHGDTRLVQADLRDGAWTRGLGPFDAIFTLQTLHDLGGIDALASIYRQGFELLAPGGILVNADFVVSFEKDDPALPRRLPVETHRALLTRLGYVDFKCALRCGKLACMSARRAGEATKG